MNKRLEQKILNKGKKLLATITVCDILDNPHDREHKIYSIDFKYNINDTEVDNGLEFSINTHHIEYGYGGRLIGVRKFKYSLEDFNKSLAPGEKIEIISLEKPPYEFICEFNKVARYIMKYPEVWS